MLVILLIATTSTTAAADATAAAADAALVSIARDDCPAEINVYLLLPYYVMLKWSTYTALFRLCVYLPLYLFVSLPLGFSGSLSLSESL